MELADDLRRGRRGCDERAPVEHYLDPTRLSAELAMLRRLPVPFCPSAALPEAGSFLARDAAGVPLSRSLWSASDEQCGQLLVWAVALPPSAAPGFGR
jgi:hypothetical protein